MENYISKKSFIKASADKPLVNPPPRDKTCGLEPDIRFYEIEEDDDTEKGEEAEILVIYDSILAVSNQNLVKRQFPCINIFGHEGPVVINAVRDLTVKVFDHLEIVSSIDVDKSLFYTQRILRVSVL